MPDDADTPRGRRFLGTDRLAAFSDGVFSIAATLLVLDIAVHPPGTLQQVLDAWPDYLAYVVSFLTIGAAWLAHTALTGRLARSDPVYECSWGPCSAVGSKDRRQAAALARPVRDGLPATSRTATSCAADTGSSPDRESGIGTGLLDVRQARSCGRGYQTDRSFIEPPRAIR